MNRVSGDVEGRTYTSSSKSREERQSNMQHIVTHCNTLQHTATHCNTTSVEYVTEAKLTYMLCVCVCANEACRRECGVYARTEMKQEENAMQVHYISKTHIFAVRVCMNES